MTIPGQTPDIINASPCGYLAFSSPSANTGAFFIGKPVKFVENKNIFKIYKYRPLFQAV
jgi:hypothetical protein